MASTIVQENGPGSVILGRYELLEQIGRGGFSTVYRAYDRKMGRDVAVKAVMRTDELTGRATREAQAAARLGHPHIVTIFELARDESHLYLVSELVRGDNLKQLVGTGGLSDRDLVRIALQVLEALEHAHSHGIVHRDVKPENIMLADGGAAPWVKVMDFGIAQLENDQRITRTGDVVGTLSYMSPEQADGGAVDGGTDVYSAALTLYECLAGANPFRANTAAETLRNIQRGAPPLAAARPDLPRELSLLLEEAMEPDPRLRLDVDSLAAGLKRIEPDLSGEEQATTVLRRSDRHHPSAYEDLADRYGPLALRAANGGLAAIVAGMAAYGGFYPATWRLPMVLGAALAVGLLPRVGLVPLAALALIPVAAYSAALGTVLGAAVVLYLLAFALIWPRVSLLPAAAAGLGYLGIGLVYPALAGSAGRLWRGLVLALVGGWVFTLLQLFGGGHTISYLGIVNSFGLRQGLAGDYNPVHALREIVAPFQQQPALMWQPVIWLAAAVPAAVLVRRRRLILDLVGLALVNILLFAGYFSLPRLVPGFALDQAGFLKTLALCVIIQFGFLLLSPRNRPGSVPPRERI